MAKPPLLSRAKTILLVDDEDEYRVMAKWFMINFGFNVDSVRTAQEALAVFDPETHDLVITDNSMPGMSGAEMALIIKERSPSTPVLMCSGRLPEDQSSLDMVIQKPVHLLTVKDAVEKLLGPSPSRG